MAEMKVVHVTSSLGREGAGVRKVVLELSLAQQAHGIDVEVFGLTPPHWHLERSDWQGISVSAFHVVGPRAFGYAPDMVRALLSSAPGLVHQHGVWMHPGRSVLEWHRKSGGAYVISPHGMLSDVALSYSRWKKQAASLLFQDAVFAEATAFHATCTQEVEEIRAYGVKAPIELFANGIESITLPSRSEKRPKIILSLGRVAPKKALDQLVRAWADLEEEFPDWAVWIVGPDEIGERARLEALVDSLSLERVEFRGAVYGEEKLKLMRDADIFALPTRSENFALTVAESLVLEVPVIASKGAPWFGLDEEGCGRWVDFGAAPMAAALREMITLDDADRRQMGVRGRRWMQRDFSWSSIALQSFEAYGRILGAPL